LSGDGATAREWFWLSRRGVQSCHTSKSYAVSSVETENMIKRFVWRAIDKFERDWKYDASYMRDMIDARSRATWLFSRATGLLAAAALAVGIGLAAPAAADAPVQPAAASAYTLTPRRIGASLAVVVALTGAVIGGRALARSAGRIDAANGRR